MIQIYHNPRCSKSREGLLYLENKGLEYRVVKYLDEALTTSEIEAILAKLQYSPLQLIRTSEALWKENFTQQQWTDQELIAIMAEHPKLIERPIVIHNDRAVIARPTEKIAEIL